MLNIFLHYTQIRRVMRTPVSGFDLCPLLCWRQTSLNDFLIGLSIRALSKSGIIRSFKRRVCA